MSVQFKVPLFILASFIINILFVGIYYNIALATNIAKTYSYNQEVLETSAEELSRQIEALADYQPVLEKAAAQNQYIIEVEDRNGNSLFSTGSAEGVNLNLSVTAPFVYNQEVLILKVTNPLSLGFTSSMNVVNDLFVAEFFIISFTLMMLALLLYVNSARPIVELQRNIRQYKSGIKPRHTKRKDEIGMLQNDFVELTEALDEEKRIQYRMIASISHDIRTPLTSVMGYAEQLVNGNISPERHEKYLATIYAKSQSIKELVDEFDDYISIQIQPSDKKQSITVGNLCKWVEENYRDELQTLNASLVILCDCPERKMELELSKMNRVFGNIIGNSVRYAKTEPLEISLRCSAKNDKIQFCLSDNGIGISEENIAKIFEPFYTSDPSRRVAGLGLSICKSIIEYHGGKIWAESNKPCGLSVCFSLPQH